MEPDLEEEAIIEGMYPPEFEDEIDALREAKEIGRASCRERV